MALQWISGKVTRKHVWSDGLFTLSIHCPGVAPFEVGTVSPCGHGSARKAFASPLFGCLTTCEYAGFFLLFAWMAGN